MGRYLFCFFPRCLPITVCMDDAPNESHFQGSVKCKVIALHKADPLPSGEGIEFKKLRPSGV